MIARIWRGVVRTQDADGYAGYIRETGLDDYQKTPGNQGGVAAPPDEGGRTEFLTFSLWESRETIAGFAGQDIEKAVYYPEDERVLVERDVTVRHYDVADAE
jgi:heme-degrading monooxygenase HmoA